MFLRTSAALLLLSSIAMADKPEVVDEVAWLRVQVAMRDAALARRAAEDAMAASNELVNALRAKHHMVDGDDVDPKTRVIKRAPRPQPITPKK